MGKGKQPQQTTISEHFGGSSHKVKTVYLIRHGQSEANARNSSARYIDSPLSIEGKSQSAELQETIRDWGMPIELIVVSPLSRALETCMRGFPEISKAYKKGTSLPYEVVVNPLCAERIHHHGDVGRPVSVLRKEFPMFNFNHLREKWWLTENEDRGSAEPVASGPHKKQKRNNTENGSIETPPGGETAEGKFVGEKKERFLNRVNGFRKWLQSRPEHSIVVVGHSTYFMSLNPSNALRMENCEVQKMKL